MADRAQEISTLAISLPDFSGRFLSGISLGDVQLLDVILTTPLRSNTSASRLASWKVPSSTAEASPTTLGNVQLRPSAHARPRSCCTPTTTWPTLPLSALPTRYSADTCVVLLSSARNLYFKILPPTVSGKLSTAIIRFGVSKPANRSRANAITSASSKSWSGTRMTQAVTISPQVSSATPMTAARWIDRC